MINDSIIHLDVVTGSKAHGLSRPDSDTDRRGFYIASTKSFWNFETKPKEQYEDKTTDRTYYEVQKFMSLALKGNPSVLEVLAAKDVLKMSEWGRLIRDNRKIFYSKNVIPAYGGYAKQQVSRFRTYLDDGGKMGDSNQYRWKSAMHTARLYISAIHLLEHGELLVDVGNTDHRSDIIAIRDGKWSEKEFFAYADHMDNEYKKAAEKTHLPDKPSFGKANEILRSIRMHFLNEPTSCEDIRAVASDEGM